MGIHIQLSMTLLFFLFFLFYGLDIMSISYLVHGINGMPTLMTVCSRNPSRRVNAFSCITSFLDISLYALLLCGKGLRKVLRKVPHAVPCPISIPRCILCV
jgi:hypothetical protein